MGCSAGWCCRCLLLHVLVLVPLPYPLHAAFHECHPASEDSAQHLPAPAQLSNRYGTAYGPATHAIASEMTMPRHREATADEKKRSAVIYAESLRCALAAPAQQPQPRAGRR